MFLGYALYAGRLWTRQKSMLEDSIQRKGPRPKMVKHWNSQSQMEQSNCLEEISVSENPPQCGTQLKEKKKEKRCEELQRWSSWRIGRFPQLIETMMVDREARNDFCSIEGNDIYRTTLDVLQESRIEYDWNIDGDRNLPELRTGFTQFTTLTKKPPDGYMWSGERLTQIQTTTRPDHLWPEISSWMSKSRSTKGKAAMSYRETEARQCANFEGHLFYRSGWSGVQGNHQKTQKKMELPMEAAMPFKLKTFRHRETCSESYEIRKSKYACIMEAHESTREHLERTLPKDHGYRVAGKEVQLRESL